MKTVAVADYINPLSFLIEWTDRWTENELDLQEPTGDASNNI